MAQLFRRQTAVVRQEVIVDQNNFFTFFLFGGINHAHFVAVEERAATYHALRKTMVTTATMTTTTTIATAAETMAVSASQSPAGSGFRVRDLTVEEVRLLQSDDSTDGLVIESIWSLSGEVGHWGHIHERDRRIRGRLRFGVEDSVWKLAALTLLPLEHSQ